MGAEVMDDRLLRVIAEGHMAQLDVPPCPVGVDRASLAPGLFLFIQHGEYPFGRRHGRLEGVAYAGDLIDRLAQAAGILDEGLDIADRDPPGRSGIAAQNGHKDIGNIAHQIHYRLDEAAEELAAPRYAIELVVEAGELFDRSGLMVKDLYDGVAAIAFLDHAVDLGQRGLTPLEEGLRPAHDL